MCRTWLEQLLLPLLTLWRRAGVLRLQEENEQVGRMVGEPCKCFGACMCCGNLAWDSSCSAARPAAVPCHAKWAQLLHAQPSDCLPPHPHKSCHLRACLSLQFLGSYREESQRLAEVHWAGCCWTPPLRGSAS